ncbi:MAG: glycosyltransferase family 2 protein [Woeseiaceae bacterium]|nr:glycosyltransferase family 2 protein [Woeseiaceae bacterium]
MSSRAIHRSSWIAGLLFAAGLAGALTIFVNAGLSFPIFLLASSVVLIDGIDIAVRLYLRHNANRREKSIEASPRRLQPFAICLSVYNMQNDVDELLDSLEPYRSSVWIIDDASNDATVSRLRAAGWRVFASERNQKKPAAIKLLLKQLPPEIRSVLVMDPDVRLPGNLPDRIRAFQSSDAAAMCPRVTVRPDGWLAELQHIEYSLSFDLGRHSLTPQTVTSGVALYDRRMLEDVLSHHSLSVYGEDLENAVVLLGEGKDIIYDPQLVVETDGKRSVYGWFSQRVGWSFSLLKVYAEHFSDIRKIIRRSVFSFYQFGLYFILLSMLLWPLKIISIGLLAYSALNGLDELLGLELLAENRFNHPGYFAALYVKYSFIALAAYLLVTPANTVRRGLLFMPLFFLYCIALVVPTGIGYLNWICLRLFGRRVYADHYDDSPVLGRPQRNV